MRVAGFVKIRNELLREGNLYRLLDQLDVLCDGGVICDDASTDGTTEVIRFWLRSRPAWSVLRVAPAAHNFRREMFVKQEMLELLHASGDEPDWILWMDGDELFDLEGLANFRKWLAHESTFERGPKRTDVWAFHYTQLWRSLDWARTDDGFDNGWFWKLWRYSEDLEFETRNELHTYQFPRNFYDPIMEALRHGGSHGLAKRAPLEILHLGNTGKNLVWKAIQYRNSGALEGASLQRHLYFGGGAEYRRVDRATMPSALLERFENAYPVVVKKDKVSEAMMFTKHEQHLIERLGSMKGREGLAVVIIPTFNRGLLLKRAIDSVIAQTYSNWALVVLDDGSTDNTPALMRDYQDADPRIFYCRYEKNRGGVAMNEVGADLACEFGEFWVRLGSDDYFKPHKLELDVAAFKLFPDAGVCFGPYRDLHNDSDERDLRNLPVDARGALLSMGFGASWANIAVRTSLLKQVRERHGRFCEPELRNMEDWLLNVRLAYLSEFIWRGRTKAGLLVAATILGEVTPIRELVGAAFDDPKHGLDHDAVWHIAADGASQKSEVCGLDANKTRKILEGSMTAFTPTPRQPTELKVRR